MKRLSVYISLLLILSCAKEDSQDPGTAPGNINIVPKYTLTVSAGDGGSVSTLGGSYSKGTQVIIEATPNEGYRFTGWSNGSSDSSIVVTLNSNISITANFEFVVTYSLKVIAGDGGSVSSEGGDYSEGTQVTITATPDEGYEFVSWSDGSEEKSITITITEETSIEAIFSRLDPIYLDSNGITIKAYSWASPGEVFQIDGVEYKVVDIEMLKSMISDGQDLSNIVTSNITDMSELFWYRCCYQGEYKRLDPVGNISHWDVSSVTNMKYMFMGSEFNQDISAWDVSNVQDMSYIFNDNLLFDQDLSSWDVSNVNQCELFFNYFDEWPDNKKPQFSSCETGYEVNESGNFVNPIYLDENGFTFKADQNIIPDRFYYLNNRKFWVPSQEIGISGGRMGNIMFGGSKEYTFHPHYHKIEQQYDYLWLTAEEVGFEFITSLATSLENLFSIGSNYRIYKDLSSWDVSNVTNMDNLFSDKIISLPRVNIGYWDVSNVTSMKNMFSGTSFESTIITEGSIGSWDVSNVTDMTDMFSRSNFNEYLGSWDVSNVRDMTRMFFQNSSFNQNLSSWDVSSVKLMDAMFSESVFNNDISTWDVSSVEYFTFMFASSSFNQIIKDWNLASAKSIQGMFYNNKAFRQIIRSWDVSNVTNTEDLFMQSVFNGDISNWDVSNVRRMGWMFLGSQFNRDISNWDVSNVVDMKYMFMDSEFNQDISAWDVSKVTNMYYMFYSTQFNQDLSSWDVSNVSECRYFSHPGTNWSLPKPNFTSCSIY